MIDGFAVVDGHVHTYMDGLAGRIISSFTEFHRMEPTSSIGEGSTGALLGLMDEGCIDMAVTANFGPIKAVDRINEWNIGNSYADPRLIPLVSVYPGMSSEVFSELADRGARGVKMHNGIQGFDACDPGLDDVYGICAERGLPVTLHCGEVSRIHLNELCDEDHIEAAVREHRDVMFVLTHMAAANLDTVLYLASRYRNIVFDTSIAVTGECCIHRIHDPFWEDDANVVEVFRRIGCDRIAFGSDYPYGNPVSDTRRFASLDLSDREKACILGINTMRLYGYEEDLPGGMA